jgi:hypothetical protein
MNATEQLKRLEAQLQYVNNVLADETIVLWEAMEYNKLRYLYETEIDQLKSHIEKYNLS